MADKENENIIETIDEEGNPIYFQLFDVIDYNNQDYALLMPVSDDEDEDEEPELVLMRLVSDGDDEYSLETIEDEDEFNAVSEFIADYEDEDEDEE